MCCNTESSAEEHELRIDNSYDRIDRGAKRPGPCENDGSRGLVPGGIQREELVNCCVEGQSGLSEVAPERSPRARSFDAAVSPAEAATPMDINR